MEQRRYVTRPFSRPTATMNKRVENTSPKMQSVQEIERRQMDDGRDSVRTTEFDLQLVKICAQVMCDAAYKFHSSKGHYGLSSFRIIFSDAFARWRR